MALEGYPGSDITPLFTEYRNKVFRLAISIVHNDKDAEDVVQNTFIKVLRNLRYFRHESNISTWIYRITYNEALMYLRKKRRQFGLTRRAAREAKMQSGGLFINWSKIPDEEVIGKEQRIKVAEAIRGMPIKYRLPVLLHHLEAMPLKQAAEVLGISLSSLKSRLHRAIEMVHGALTRNIRAAQSKPAGRCSVWIKLVYDYVKNDLDAQTKRAFAKHMVDCSKCTGFINNYGRALAVTSSLECQDIPREMQENLESFWRGQHPN